MSSEIFDRNIGDLVKRGALKPDAARARERFLAEVSATPERRTWKIAAAAAAVLLCSVIVWSAKPGKPVPEVITIPRETIVAKTVPLQGNDLLRGELQLPSGDARRTLYHFIGHSTLPDGLYFQVKVQRLSEELSGAALQPAQTVISGGNHPLQNGGLDYTWQGAPGFLRIEVSAPDGLQELAMVRMLKVKEADRAWSFEYPAWDDRLRTLLEPQLAEIADLAGEARKIVDRCQAAVATEELFRSQQKQLAADAERLQRRVAGFGEKSLYPAALHEIEYTIRNLGVLMQYFKWADGKFAGAKSYYGDGKGDLTHRNEAFSFDALRRYLDESVQIGGREFCLWILKDVRRAGLQEAHRTLVKRQLKTPGVEPFAVRLMNTPAEDLGALEAMLRKL